MTMSVAARNFANKWSHDACAKAFWSQQECEPYQQLLADTMDWASPKPNEKWLDLGCGGGAVTREIWKRTDGRIANVVGLDCAAANAAAYRKLQDELGESSRERVSFIHHDFSGG